MDVRYIYMGSGNGCKLAQNYIKQHSFAIIKRKKEKNRKGSITDDLKKIFSLVYFISLENERNL